MRLRRLLLRLLIVSLAITTAMGQETPAAAEPEFAPQDEGRGGVDDERLTPGEEREARELAERFEQHMLATCDVEPLIGEMYVRDFGPRLLRGADTVPFIARPETDEAAAAFTEDELRRFYVALMNLWCAGFRLYAAYEPAPDAAGNESEPKFEQVFPAEAVAVLKSDPSFVALMGDTTGITPEREADADDEAEEAFIKTPEQMRDFTATVEQALFVVREHLARRPDMGGFRRMWPGSSATEKDLVRPRLTTLDREYYGFPVGTRLVCADALMFHLDMVRVGGRLRVVTAYLNSD